MSACVRCVSGMCLDDQTCGECHGTGFVAELVETIMRPGYGLSLVARHPVVATMAEELVKMYDEAGASNYVEVSMWHKTRGEFVMTVQRKQGRTPHECRLDAESKLAAAGEDTAQAPLLIHFLEMLSEKLAAAGCNDMDLRAFDEVHDMPKLRAMFDVWNPEYIGEPLERIPDFLWVEFLTDQLRDAIDAARKESR